MAMAAATHSAQQVEMVIAQLDALPPLAPVTPKILSITMDPTAGVSALAEAVSSDPSLTARVLSLAGRAHLGVRPRSADLSGAIKLLGFAAIRQVALATKVMEVFGFSSPGALNGLDRAEYWKHCLGVACCAGSIARIIGGTISETEAFVLGLLHDLGKVALDAALPKSYERVLRRVREQKTDLTDAERAVFGVDHTVVGRRLAERWALPQRLIDVIWLHHLSPFALPSNVAAERHVQIVQLADAWVRQCRIGFSGTRQDAIEADRLAEALGVSSEQKATILETLGEQIAARASWIGKDDLTSREVYIRALLATTEELSAANANLNAQNARLSREACYFAALGRLNEALTPHATVREVCGIGAEVVRSALGLSSAAMVVPSHDGPWQSLGLSEEGVVSTQIRESSMATADGSAPPRDDQAAGVWILPVDTLAAAEWEPIRHRLGEGPLWEMPVVFRGQRVGMVYFAATAQVVGARMEETAQLAALSAALGLAVAQARSQADARTMNEALAEANRRQSAMQAEVIRSRNLEAIVAMAAGAAHELNNPLTVISGRAQMLRTDATPGQRESLDQIVSHTKAASGIVTELMEFASPRPAAPAPVSLQDLLTDLRTELIEAGLLAEGAMTVDVASDTPTAWFDPEYAVRLFRELLNNAIEATYAEDRRVAVKAWRDPTDEGIVVQVIDNGRGMTHEVLGRAMDPFYSHRPAGRGRGLGLSRVSRWLADAGGSISIESSPGQGATVELRLASRPANG
jgi:putative nucleotidyltransferase with HDIG domain